MLIASSALISHDGRVEDGGKKEVRLRLVANIGDQEIVEDGTDVFRSLQTRPLPRPSLTGDILGGA